MVGHSDGFPGSAGFSPEEVKEAARVVHVGLGADSYEIIIDSGLISNSGRYISKINRGGNVVIVSDRHVAPLFMDDMIRSLELAGLDVVDPIILQPGEQTKSMEVWEDLVETLLGRGVDRSSTIIALGGGVIGDLAGFAAAVTMRGIDFVQVPTTLLAQVDSAVGGKTGINSPHGKNLIGAFYQPCMVLADSRALASLPERELKAGYAEVVKYGLINRPEFFEWLDDGNAAAMLRGDDESMAIAVETCCRAKAEIVERDERESGERALLNLGHTFGHAFERASGYDGTLLHGEAVSIGMVCAFDLSVRLGLCSMEDRDRVRSHLREQGLPVSVADLPSKPSWTAEDLLQHMLFDKKTRAGQKTFILANGIGKAFVTSDVDDAVVLEVLENTVSRSGAIPTKNG